MKNIVELSKKEMISIDGGFWPILAAYLAIAGWCANEHDNLAAGWAAGADTAKG